MTINDIDLSRAARRVILRENLPLLAMKEISTKEGSVVEIVYIITPSILLLPFPFRLGTALLYYDYNEL